MRFVAEWKKMTICRTLQHEAASGGTGDLGLKIRFLKRSVGSSPTAPTEQPKGYRSRRT